jgi:phosphoglycerate dehydrogenase-like enzyme
MTSSPLTVWCNQHLPEPAMAELRERMRGHKLVFPPSLYKLNLAAGGPDPLLAQADVALGQPDPQQCMMLPSLKWVHLTTAGYTRYDRDDLREAFRRRGAMLTNSSTVYSEPCAQQALAYMLAIARRLPQCLDEQRTTRSWNAAEHRRQCRLLGGQTIVILGFGAIASRLVQLLAPFGMNVIAIRRVAQGNEGCRTLPSERLEEVLPLADHVMNILPANAATENFMNRARFAAMKPGSIYYNIGRGTTQDQPALIEFLTTGHLSAAYLDVTDPEPLPADHPLWTTPNCYITPHTAGGADEEFHRLVRHFGDNLDRFIAGTTLKDRVV